MACGRISAIALRGVMGSAAIRSSNNSLIHKEDVMSRARSLVALLLLAGICCVSLMGIPEEAAAAPIGCSTLGCGGGPDNCMSISVSIRGAEISITCYVKAAPLQLQ